MEQPPYDRVTKAAAKAPTGSTVYATFKATLSPLPHWEPQALSLGHLWGPGTESGNPGIWFLQKTLLCPGAWECTTSCLCLVLDWLYLSG